MHFCVHFVIYLCLLMKIPFFSPNRRLTCTHTHIYYICMPSLWVLFSSADLRSWCRWRCGIPVCQWGHVTVCTTFCPCNTLWCLRQGNIAPSALLFSSTANFPQLVQCSAWKDGGTHMSLPHQNKMWNCWGRLAQLVEHQTEKPFLNTYQRNKDVCISVGHIIIIMWV